MESSSGKEVPVDHLCLASLDVEGSTIGVVVLHLAGDLTEEGCAAGHYFLLLFGNEGFVVVAFEKAFVDQA